MDLLEAIEEGEPKLWTLQPSRANPPSASNRKI
jgi:hypothetical protein